MATSTAWALLGGVVVVGGVLGGTVAWKHAHPDSPSPLSALAPMIPQLAPAPPAKLGAAAPVAPGLQPADPGPAPPTAPNPEAAPADAPKFDVVRVEPTGEAVVAGSAKPDSQVALVASGKVVAEAKADANGQFVMTPPALKPGDYDLSLQQTEPGKAAQPSAQAVAVAVPDKGKGQVVVALAEPGKPTKVMSSPVPPPPAAPGAEAKPTGPAKLDIGAKLAVRSVELENGTGFYANGSAPPGTPLHVYLNDSHLADVTAAATGEWTLRIGKGLTGGRYKVRVDAIGPDGHAVTARVEVPFDVPFAMAKADPAVSAAARAEAPMPPSAPAPGEASSAAEPSPAQVAAAEDPPTAAKSGEAVPAPTRASDASSSATPAPAAPADQAAAVPPASTASNVVVDAVETARVIPGDNLWNISRIRLGEGMRYTQIYTANAAQIRNPNLIYPGQVFVVPKN